MANNVFNKAVEGFGDGTLDWDTQAFKAALVNFAVADTGVKAITGATNATPIVVTATAHGYANGDLVLVGKVVGNLAANGIWKIANAAANTFELTDPITGANVAGSGVYTSGGYAVNLGGAAGDNLDDFDACRVGTDQTLTGKTVALGVFDCDDQSFPNLSSVNADAVLYYRDTGTGSTSRAVYLHDGRQIVTCAAQAASGATSIAVERLAGGIPNGTVLAFSNGVTATLSAAANAGDRTVTVSATGAIITAGSRADAPITGTGFPLSIGATPVTVNVAVDNGPNKLFAL